MSENPPAPAGPNVDVDAEAKCPVAGTASWPGGTKNKDWWPNQLDLSALQANPPSASPMGEDFDDAEEFASLALEMARNSYFNAQCVRLDGAIRMAPR